MKRALLSSALACGLVAALSGHAAAKDAYLTKPPANFKKVSTLVKLPDFLPGLGTLYVDPKTLPVGPFLGYDKKGALVNVTYMVPLKQLEARKGWDNLGNAVAGAKVDHTDISYNPGHPGVEEPHYHFINWLIPHSEEAARVGGGGEHSGH
ncbi:hypothetical protein J7643_04055 [bacterium]|nr:hypothetical protein [bacterium]